MSALAFATGGAGVLLTFLSTLASMTPIPHPAFQRACRIGFVAGCALCGLAVALSFFVEPSNG